MLITVIVPVYNQAKRLERCLSSIVAQTYQNIEVIVVDDGSTDGSGELCDNFAERDRRITVIHQTNRGVSAARNAALDIARGDFIGFVDSDDWVEPNMYEQLLKIAMETGVKIAACGHCLEGKRWSKAHAGGGELEIWDVETAFKKVLLPGCVEGFLWNKLFAREMIGEKRLDSELIFCEDQLFVCECLREKHRMAYTNNSYYHYVLHDESVTASHAKERFYSEMEARHKVLAVLPTSCRLTGEAAYTWACYGAVRNGYLPRTKDKPLIRFFRGEGKRYRPSLWKSEFPLLEKVKVLGILCLRKPFCYLLSILSRCKSWLNLIHNAGYSKSF